MGLTSPEKRAILEIIAKCVKADVFTKDDVNRITKIIYEAIEREMRKETGIEDERV